MDITIVEKVEETGSVLLKSSATEVEKMLPAGNIFVHKHPRVENAVLVTIESTEQNEHKGYNLYVDKIQTINGEAFSGSRSDLIIALSKVFNNGGGSGNSNGAAITEFKMTDTILNTESTVTLENGAFIIN